MSEQPVLRTFLSFFFACGILALFVAGGTTESRAEDLVKEGDTIALVPHKALYDIKLISKDSSAQVLNISGQMYYELQKSCGEWITDHRFKLQYEYADSPPVQMSSDFLTAESFDDRSFSFISRRKKDGEVYEIFQGKADVSAQGKTVVDYAEPEGLSFDFSGVYFPTKHTKLLLEKARQGQSFFSAKVFDGSDGEGPAEINAFIGKRVNPVAEIAEIKDNADIDMTLVNTPAWKVRMAFFPLKEPGTAAEYEMALYFHENGIVSDMTVDYEDFSVSQKLVALEKIEPDECGAR